MAITRLKYLFVCSEVLVFAGESPRRVTQECHVSPDMKFPKALFSVLPNAKCCKQGQLTASCASALSVTSTFKRERRVSWLHPVTRLVMLASSRLPPYNISEAKQQLMVVSLGQWEDKNLQQKEPRKAQQEGREGQKAG
jgi:hypothetical protein